jgi:hypothetical protein
VTVADWLARRGMALPARAGDECRLADGDGRELILTAGAAAGEWLLLARAGPCPPAPGAGTLLLLLQLNSPFSDLAPMRLTADGAGELLLWIGIADGGAAGPALDAACHTLALGQDCLARVLRDAARAPVTAHGWL